MQRRQSRALTKRRLRFLIALKSGACTSQAQAGRLIGVKERAAEKLWKLYGTKGLEGLLERPHSGQPPKLDEAAKQALQQQLYGDHIQTLKQACAFVLSHNEVCISQADMHNYFKARGIRRKPAVQPVCAKM